MERYQIDLFILRNPSVSPKLLIIDEPKYRYNRVKFNRMDYAEQRIYDEKLKIRKVTYGFGDDSCFINIPKKLFNTMQSEGMEVASITIN